MKSEQDIRKQANALIGEMYEMNKHPASDLFSHMDNMRTAVGHHRELKTIYEILEEPLPDFIVSLMSCDNHDR